MAKSGAIIAMGAGIVFGSLNDAHRHTMEYGDQATRNMTIITIDICQQQTTTTLYKTCKFTPCSINYVSHVDYKPHGIEFIFS